LFETIERTETPTPETLVIHTKHPDVLIPARLAWLGKVVPWAYIDRVGFTGFNQRPLGTGPLRFVSWTKGERCVLDANPDYWDGRLDLDRVVFRPVPEPAARVEGLLRGEADLVVGSHPSTLGASLPTRRPGWSARRMPVSTCSRSTSGWRR
jgi:peptide/nickel transport system substrate-binding protein